MDKRFKDQENLLRRNLQNRLRDRFYARCESYVRKLTACYEEFYGSYDMILEEFGADIRTIERKLDQSHGVTYSYICADYECREKLHDELSERRSYDEGAVSGISYELFRLIHEVGLESSKMATRECADKIKDFWHRDIEKEEIGKEILDMNILRAMSKQEECKIGRSLTETGFAEKIRQVQNVLVAPFLQYFQRLDMNTGISLCCYHSSLKHEVGVYRSAVEWLNDHNAVDDDTYCTNREIMFYRSFVGLEAYEVLEFLHGISAKTAVTGQAFQSYQDMLGDMGKSTWDASKVMTPHADTTWSSLYNMPDPSRDYQDRQERYIAVALLYAWLSRKITRTNGAIKYSFTSPGLGEMGFDRIYEFHKYLYGNYYWYMELCREMWRKIKEEQRQNKNYYDTIAKDRSSFDLIAVYQAELQYGERKNAQRWQIVDAAKKIIYACTQEGYAERRTQKCMEQIKEQIDKTYQAVKSKSLTVSAVDGSGKTVSSPIDIDDDLKSALEDFFAKLQPNLDKMFDRAFEEEMRDFFDDLQDNL